MAFASFASRPSFTNNKVSLTKVQKTGLRYEKRAQTYVNSLCDLAGKYRCLCNPWIMYSCRGDPDGSVNFCQPDIVLVDSNDSRVVICEVKLSHTADSWKQLRQLYEPVLRHIYPRATISLVEICKWFDPHTQFPETFYYEENPLNAVAEKFAIHIYKPRGREVRSKK